MIVNVHMNTPLLQDAEAIPAIVADLVALGCASVRIAIRARNAATPDGELKSGFTEMVHRFVAAADGRFDLLAYVYGVHDDDAALYFHDPDAFRARWHAFVAGIAREFRGEIRLWEIWNEPNVSWSYLSRADGEGHRPWTGAEFVRDILLPASEAVRAADPENRVVVGAFAEDGIRGHRDRAPAFSEQISREHPLYRTHGSRPADRFFVLPDFVRGLAPALAAHRAAFDAVAQHPYPYFQGDGAVPLHLQSIEKLTLAREVLDAAGLDDTPVIVSETGARELDFFGKHDFLPGNQLRYFEGLMTELAARQAQLKIERLYWYQWRDRPGDMAMEKPFGLLDLTGARKPIYHAVQAHNLRARGFRSATFRAPAAGDALAGILAGFNPERTRFAFFLPVADGTLVTPGRGLDEWLALTPRDLDRLADFAAAFEVALFRRFRIALVGPEDATLFRLVILAKRAWLMAGEAVLAESDLQSPWERIGISLADRRLSVTMDGAEVLAADLPGAEPVRRVDVASGDQRVSLKLVALSWNRAPPV